jgi:glycolate oxidase FAD binding subunit
MHRVAEAFGADRVAYARGADFRLGEEAQRVVAYPHNIEELAQLMKLAHTEGWRVAPAGAGTWLEMGNAIVQFHMIVSTAQMNRVLEYEPADLTCSVEAGVVLHDFNLRAAEHNQFLPLDPFGDERATIGATVATASYGPLRASYGTPRDWLVGCRVVHADGTITSAGGKVVKNVAGYDLCKLYTGSFGTLVVLAELNFKMRALPRADATQVFYADDAAALCALTARLYDSDLAPTAMELLSPHAGLSAQAGIDEERYALVLRYVNEEQETVAWQTGEAARLGNGMANSILSLAAASTFWQSYYLSETSDERFFSLRASVLPSDLGKLIETVQRLMPNALLRAHAVNGVLRIHGGEDLLSEMREKHRYKLLLELREFTKQCGGSLVILRAPDELKKQLDVWGGESANMNLMRGLKQQFDPLNRLNFGRFVAGL